MGKKNTIECVDLFAGAGGTSTGLIQAAEEHGYEIKLTAINHWDVAIATHTANHPKMGHLCTSLESVDPLEVVPSGRLKLLVASPECTHHSNARGGKPMNNQRRSTAWYIINWAEKLYIENILIENVREWRDWGPLNQKHRPIQSKKGEFFLQFVKLLETLDYRVEWRILNAADYGEPTTRERLFVQARKKRTSKAITWPQPTHKRPGAEDQVTLFGDQRKPWEPARKIIDWNLQSQSIFARKKPLAPSTMNRIMAGFKRRGSAGEPFLVVLRNHMAAQSLDKPLPTLAASGGHMGLREQFIMPLNHGKGDHRSYDVEQPIPTVTSADTWALAEGSLEPFITTAGGTEGQGRTAPGVSLPLGTILTNDRRALVEPRISRIDEIHNLQRKQNSTSADEPIPTVTATSSDFALVEAEMKPVDDTSFLVVANHGGTSGRRDRSLDEPLPTLACSNSVGIVQAQAFMVPFFGERSGQEPRTHSIDEPLPTVTSHGAGGVVEAFITPANHGKDDDRTYSLENPMPAITTVDALGFTEGKVEPVSQEFLTKFFGTGKDASVDDPLDTVTAKDRFGLVQATMGGPSGVLVQDEHGQKYLLDIRFRMLRPHELAAAMGFPRGYKFTGNRENVVKQIGNAVAVGMARALCSEILRPKESVLAEPRKKEVAA